MILPLWALYSLAAALCVTVMMLVQERVKADGFALSFWIKVFVVLFTLPFAWEAGWPTDARFYWIMAVTAVLYCVSDVVYFRALPHIGSGLMTRLMPGAVVASFFLWLVVDHSLVAKYLSHPWQTAGILFSIAMAAVSAMFLKKCKVSMDGVKKIWPVIFAAAVGPTINKLGLNQAPVAQAAYAFIVVQGAMMIVLWLAYWAVRRPITAHELAKPSNIKAALAIGVFSAIMMVMKMRAVVEADNPAYVSILMYTDALWVIIAYKIMGKRETSNIWAGLGIVASAVLLIIFKSWH